jgi:predicted transcriptional regulator YdeE
MCPNAILLTFYKNMNLDTFHSPKMYDKYFKIYLPTTPKREKGNVEIYISVPNISIIHVYYT